MKSTSRQNRLPHGVKKKKKPVYMKALSLPESQLCGVTQAVPELQPPGKFAEPENVNLRSIGKLNREHGIWEGKEGIPPSMSEVAPYGRAKLIYENR